MIRAPRAITTFGLGYMRPFPGTWGSLPPCAVAAVLILVDAGPSQAPWIWYSVLIAFIVYFSAACIRQGEHAEAHFCKKDPSQVVADETAGQAIALLFVPPSAISGNLRGLAIVFAAFVLFRLWDILKPWPISQIQTVPGGWGILLDDILAGIGAGVMVLVGILLFA